MALEGNDGVGNDGASGAASGASGSAASGSAAASGVSGSGNPNPADKFGADFAKEKAAFIADLQKERTARQVAERAQAEHAARLAERDRQIQALTGTKIPSAEDADDAKIRARLEKMYPALGKLSPEVLERLAALDASKDELETLTKSQWTRSNRQMIEGVYTDISKEMGDLTDRQKKRIDEAYIAAFEADPDFQARHAQGDPTLAKEFVKNFLEDFVEPVRRRTTANELSRVRAVPFGKDRSIPAQGEKKLDVTDPKAVEDFLVNSYKDKGGVFGHR